jgi:hypothetical protein
MGGAFVAVANDATSLYWNAAGIARLTRARVSLNHTPWLADSRFDYVGLVVPMGRVGALGLSFTSLSMADMEVRTVFYPEGTGERFSAGDLALALSYGRELTDRFSIGFTGKYIQQNIWHMKASSFAIDVGTLFTTQFNGMRIGMSISNFGNKMQLFGKDTQVLYDIDPVKSGNNDKIMAYLGTDKWSLPLMLRVGIAMEVIDTPGSRLTIASEVLSPNDNIEGLNVGFEYAFYDNIFLRGGYKSIFQTDSEEGLTVGVGAVYTLPGKLGIAFDYAYANFGILNSVQRFSLELIF